MQTPLQTQTNPQPPIKWTVDDYHRMIEAGILDERNVELLDGKICLMPPEGAPHARRSGSLADKLYDKLASRALVRKAAPIILATSEPEPDIAIVSGCWADYDERHPNAEEVLLAIEFSKTSLAKDLGTKRILYAKAYIQEYWVIDLNSSQLIVFRNPQDADYQQETTLQQGKISPLAFPDISLSVEKIIQGF